MPRASGLSYNLPPQHRRSSGPQSGYGRWARSRGGVVGGPPELVRGIRLVFTSENNVRPRPFPLKKWPIEGYADVKTDKQGRFGVPAIAVGEAWIEHYNVDEKQPLLLKLPESVSVQADRTTSLEIPLVPSVIVRGSVRVKDTGKPVSARKFTSVTVLDIAREPWR